MEETSPLLTMLFFPLCGVHWHRVYRRRRKHCETSACLTLTPTHSSQEGVALCMCVCVCVGREWREPPPIFMLEHFVILILCLCVSVWAYFSVQHGRLADSPPFPDLTRRANARLIWSFGLYNTDKTTWKPTPGLPSALSRGEYIHEKP